MGKPTYWACTDCIENCMLIRQSDAVDPYACTEDNEDVSWKNITRDEFLRRDSLLNDPSHIVPKLDKTPGLRRKEEEKLSKSQNPDYSWWHDVMKPSDSWKKLIAQIIEDMNSTINTIPSIEGPEVKEAPSKFAPGDRVVITDRILYWIEKFGWTMDMKRYINQIVTLEHRARLHGYEKATGCLCWVAEEAMYSWPEDCLKKA
jgi:hypothetical protein